MGSPIRPHVKVGPTATHLPELPVATHSNFRPVFALSSTPTIFLYHGGIDLLQRLSVRPKLLGLQNEVFGENRPQPCDVIDYWKKFQPQNCFINSMDHTSSV